ncbi:MAG: hypothetical protein HZB40_06320 [Rhodocyclales bacterium]|nr:hypothetical protein [Rhodocyclales bacterium]
MNSPPSSVATCIHFLDAGLQASLVRLTPERAALDRARFGASLETWAYGELLKTLALAGALHRE